MFLRPFFAGSSLRSRARRRSCDHRPWLFAPEVSQRRAPDQGFRAVYQRGDDLIYYDRYDLTEHLLEGENVLAIELGNGFQCLAAVWDFDRAPWIGAPRPPDAEKMGRKPASNPTSRC